MTGTRAALLAVLLAVGMVACGPTIKRVQPDSPTYGATVRVGTFTTDGVRVLNFKASPAPYANEIPGLIVEALRKAGISAELAGEGLSTEGLTVTGRLDLVDGGNRSLRCMVGYGAGSVHCSVAGNVRDASGRLIGEFGVEQGSSLCDFGDDTLRRCIKAMSYDVATMITTGRYAAQNNAPARPSVEERLQQLRSLRDQDLVTPEEYERKRAEILGDL